jgi:hypothetical protein
MKLRYKLPLIFVLLDIGLSFLISQPNIVLPIINPSEDEYAKISTITSFPRNAGQILVWTYVHLPAFIIVSMLTKSITPGDTSTIYTYLGLFVAFLQTGLFFYLIGLEIERKKSKKDKTIVK